MDRVSRCQFCGKTFTRKSWASRHSCAKRKKFEATTDILVQHAYRLYVYWMTSQKLLRRGKDPSFEKFLDSPMRSAFVKVVSFCINNHIDAPYSYVDWLIKAGKLEREWCDDSSVELDKYRTFTAANEDPVEQAHITLRYIERWMLEDETRTPKEFFDRLTPGMIVTLVRQRKIMPWPLFTYEPIVSKWLDKGSYSAENFFRIDDIVNCEYWANKISETPEVAVIVTGIMDQIWQYQT